MCVNSTPWPARHSPVYPATHRCQPGVDSSAFWMWIPRSAACMGMPNRARTTATPGYGDCIPRLRRFRHRSPLQLSSAPACAGVMRAQPRARPASSPSPSPPHAGRCHRRCCSPGWTRRSTLRRDHAAVDLRRRERRNTYTASQSRRKSEQITVRLIVRRVKDKNVVADQGELFAAWRYHAFITDSTLQLVAAGPEQYKRRLTRPGRSDHNGNAGQTSGIRTPATTQHDPQH